MHPRLQSDLLDQDLPCYFFVVVLNVWLQLGMVHSPQVQSSIYLQEIHECI